MVKDEMSGYVQDFISVCTTTCRVKGLRFNLRSLRSCFTNFGCEICENNPAFLSLHELSLNRWVGKTNLNPSYRGVRPTFLLRLCQKWLLKLYIDESHFSWDSALCNRENFRQNSLKCFNWCG